MQDTRILFLYLTITLIHNFLLPFFLYAYDGSVALELREQMEKLYVPSLQDIVIDGQKIEPPTPLSWYDLAL
jgi:hypothetical protein